MKLDAIGIACKNVHQTIKFYELLGIKFKSFGEDHYEGETSNGLRLMLDSFDLMRKLYPNWKEPQTSGISLAFLLDSPQKVDEVFNNIVELEFEPVKEPWDAFWGQRYSSVLDPNGNQVDIFAPLPTDKG